MLLVLTVNKPEFELPSSEDRYSVVKVTMNRCFMHSKISILHQDLFGAIRGQPLFDFPFSITRKSNYTEYDRGLDIIGGSSAKEKVLISKFRKGDEVKLYLKKIETKI